VANNEGLFSAFALFLATHSLPHYLVESESFLNLLTLYRQATILPPTRKQIRDSVDVYADKLRHELLAVLKNNIVTVCVDGWTNVRHDKVNNIVILCKGVAYYWGSITNTLEKNTSTWIAEHLHPKFDEMIQQGIEIVAFVADNEAVNEATYDILKSYYPFLIHIPCAAHTIQLCVKYILKCQGLAELVLCVGSIIGKFDRSKDLRQKLKRYIFSNVIRIFISLYIYIIHYIHIRFYINIYI
jgi:hypothetical protein